MAEYLVRVDDNYHYQDKEYRTTAGEFDTWGKAEKKCKAIVNRFLKSDLKQHPKITAEMLFEQLQIIWT